MKIHLRDYFAAKAIHSVLTTDGIYRSLGYEPQDGFSFLENDAHLAYQIADAMLAERGRKDEEDDLTKLTEAGKKAWADVPNATEFVEDLRGDSSQKETIVRDESRDRDIFVENQRKIALNSMSFESALIIGGYPIDYTNEDILNALIVLTEKLISVGIKEEMPVFVLKPTDKHSVNTIVNWISFCKNKEKGDSADKKLNEFLDWQTENALREKEPD